MIETKHDSREGISGMKDMLVMDGWASRLVRSKAWQKADVCFATESGFALGAGAITVSILLYFIPRKVLTTPRAGNASSKFTQSLISPSDLHALVLALVRSLFFQRFRCTN